MIPQAYMAISAAVACLRSCGRKGLLAVAGYDVNVQLLSLYQHGPHVHVVFPGRGTAACSAGAPDRT
jgi:hypothetical protein